MSNHSGIFTPATLLLQKLPIARKFFLILLVFTLPMAYLSWKSVIEKQQQIGFHQRQSAGLDTLSRVTTTLMRLLELRDLGYASNLGLQVDTTLLASMTPAISSDLQGFKGLGSQASQLQLAEVQRLWQAIRVNGDDALALHNHYARLSQALRQYMHSLAEDDYVLLGEDRNSYLLSHIAINSLSYTIDLVSAIQGLGSGIISRGSFTPDSFIKLSYYSGELENNLKRLQRAYASIDTEQARLEEADNTLAMTSEFLAFTRSKVIDPDSFQVNANAFFHNGKQLLESLKTLQAATTVQLHSRLDGIIESQTWFKNEVIAISALIILVVMYLFAGFYFSMKRGIQQINTTLTAIAKGDLKCRAEVQGQDEIRNIGDNLNHMAGQLADLVQIAYSRAPTEFPRDQL